MIKIGEKLPARNVLKWNEKCTIFLSEFIANVNFISKHFNTLQSGG
jgi:hypothetical protein